MVLSEKFRKHTFSYMKELAYTSSFFALKKSIIEETLSRKMDRNKPRLMLMMR